MNNKNTTIVGGVYSTAEEAANTIRQLNDLGFTKDEISVLAPDDNKVAELEGKVDVTAESTNDEGSHTGEGAGKGALSGGILGGLVGLIAEAALITIPGVGPLAAAGPLATTLAGLGTGAVGGGIVGALVGAGIPEEDAEAYEKYIQDGNIVVLLEVETAQENDVNEIFIETGSLNKDMYQ